MSLDKPNSLNFHSLFHFGQYKKIFQLKFKNDENMETWSPSLLHLVQGGWRRWMFSVLMCTLLSPYVNVSSGFGPCLNPEGATWGQQYSGISWRSFVSVLYFVLSLFTTHASFFPVFVSPPAFIHSCSNCIQNLKQ